MATVYEKVGKMVNAVRTVAGDYYKSIVPIFKAEDSENPNPEFKQFGNIITENALVMNQFLQGFHDVILYESFRMHAFDNEFSRRFKKESDPLRRATFETFVNPANPLKYDGEALDRILKLYPRDVKRVTYVRNREDIFPVSINREEAESAFQSMEAFYDFYQQQYLMLANSNAIVEYNDIKQCFNANYASGAVKVINIHGKTPKEIATLLRELITRFTKPSSDFNNYVNLEGATGPAVVTNTPKESIVFMPDAETLAKLDIGVLQGAYNLEYAEVTRNILAVDDWGYNVYDRNNQTILRKEASKIKAVLCDEYTLKFDENLNQEMTGLNGASLTEQRFYHIWQTIALRPFCNCVVLVDDGEEPAPVGESFKIVKPDSQVIVENGEFTLEYEGNLPENFENFKGQIQINGEGYNSTDLLYNINSVDEENKTITFKISGEYNGIYNNDTIGSIVLLDINTYNVINGFITSLENVPINYASKITNTNFNGISDVTADTTVRITVVPDEVSPSPTINDSDVEITLINNSDNSSSNITEGIERDTNGYYFVIPANSTTVDTSYTMFIKFTSSDITFSYTFTTPA